MTTSEQRIFVPQHCKHYFVLLNDQTSYTKNPTTNCVGAQGTSNTHLFLKNIEVDNVS